MYGGNLSGLSSQTPMSVGEKKCHEWTEAMRASESVQSRVQFVFSFYVVKPRGGVGKNYQHVYGSRQVVKGSGQGFSCFFRSFCSRKQVRLCLANRQYSQCFK